MAIYLSVLLGVAVWIIGWALFPSPHANFDWFLPLPVFVLIAVIYQLTRPYFRNLFRP